ALQCVELASHAVVVAPRGNVCEGEDRFDVLVHGFFRAHRARDGAVDELLNPLGAHPVTKLGKKVEKPFFYVLSDSRHTAPRIRAPPAGRKAAEYTVLGRRGKPLAQACRAALCLLVVAAAGRRSSHMSRTITRCLVAAAMVIASSAGTARAQELEYFRMNTPE